MPSKSILKKAARPAISAPNPTSSADAPDPRHLEIALHHANQIQHQKDIEAFNLDSLVKLLDFPSSPDADPARPSEEDMDHFKQYIQYYQSADYDSLVEERQISERCGYTMCPRKPKRDHHKDANAKFRILKARNVENRFVEKRKLEEYCSEACARRSLYIKVQLIEEPAWTRAPGFVADIKILIDQDAPAPHHEMELALRPKQDLPEEEQARQALEDLAVERGQTRTSAVPGSVLRDDVRERKSSKPAIAPNRGEAEKSTIEGYEPKHGLHRPEARDKDDLGEKDWEV
ncbi:hypothetical protein LTS18_011332 [Coniosporium uncinatum]|uniref:Uncharacterized protein n=1 Tax=Coniosporium uncinatum TaxID=93489 RepID=A0ACC3CYL9_9PEZI|nr:hypothetical protein LTS18_011332 [Coniosporium uncinatum]